MALLRPTLVGLVLCIASCRPANQPTTVAQRSGSSTHAAARIDRDAAALATAGAGNPSVDAISQWPTLPAQSAPWRAPNESSFSQAVRWLFDHGMPDPRELEYVRARVTVGNLWGGRANSVEAHGWLYRAPDNTQWFLGWNGNLYEPEALLGPADFDADYAQLIAPPDGGNPMGYRFVRAGGGEAGALFPSINESLTNAILARLGRRGSAELASQEDLFAVLVSDYQWTLFDRAVCAHMRGDDTTTLRVATRLVAVREAAQRELARNFDGGISEEDRQDPFSFSRAAESLRNDARRRLARGPRTPSVVARSDADASAGPTGPAASAQAAAQPQTPRAIEARVRAIIDELEEVDARQWGQPGGVNLAADPRVQALIQIGETAIPALIDALERDERLTRSVHFWRDFSRHRSVLGAHEAAYTAIAAILRQDFFRIGSTSDDLSGRGPAGRAELVARVREYWTRMSGIPPHERALRTLADDRATPEQWSTAAVNLVSRDERGAQPGPMLGEPLRSQRDPSITERMVQRSTQLLALAFGNNDDSARYVRVQGADAITRALIEWDPRTPALRTLTTLWMQRSTVDQTAVYCTAALFAARDAAQDATALPEYARWLARVPYDVVEMSPREVLALTQRHADDPQIQEAARSLLSARGWIGDGRNTRRLVTVLDAMQHLAPARQFAAARLTDRTVIGELEIRGTNYSIQYRDGGSLSASRATAGRDGTYPWRVCDELTLNIGAYSDASAARAERLVGPVAARDAVVAERAAELRRPVARAPARTP